MHIHFKIKSELTFTNLYGMYIIDIVWNVISSHYRYIRVKVKNTLNRVSTPTIRRWDSHILMFSLYMKYLNIFV